MNEVATPGNDSAAGWLVYVIEASDGSLYTGITNDMARRWQQHASGRGARFFRGRQPQALVFVEMGHDRASASRREAAIKKLSRTEKLVLIAETEKQTAGTPRWEGVPAAKG